MSDQVTTSELMAFLVEKMPTRSQLLETIATRADFAECKEDLVAYIDRFVTLHETIDRARLESLRQESK